MGDIDAGCLKSCLEKLACNITDKAVESCLEQCVAAKEVNPMDIVATGVLLMLSGLFSGLTLGLMSLDVNGLEIVIAGGEPDEKRFAAAILPVRKQGNLLLCTLLLGNTLVNALIAILSASFTGGLVGALLSTGFIVIFGEIVPQSICSRHGLAIGARTLPLVKIFIVLLYVVAKPISICLDLVLGREVGALYNKKELTHLLEIHDRNFDDTDVTKQETEIMKGALKMSERCMYDIMTKIGDVFMLDSNAKLDFQTLLQIYQSGYTRIPVFDGDRNNVIGLMLSKDLILVDPDDEIAVSSLMTFCGREIKTVWYDMKVNEMLNVFKTERTHISLVQQVNSQDETRDPFYEQIGIVTLEDVLEELIQDEIVDETDVIVDNNSRSPVAEQRSEERVLRMEFIGMLEHRKNYKEHLTPSELNAVVAFLCANVEAFKGHSQSRLKKLVSRCKVINVKKEDNPLYEKGVPSASFSLVLQGRLSVQSGNEGFKTEVGPWTALVQRALTCDSKDYAIDFTAAPIETCRIVVIHKTDFQRWLKSNSVSPRAEDDPSVNVRQSWLMGSSTRPASNSRERRDSVSSSQADEDGGPETRSASFSNESFTTLDSQFRATEEGAAEKLPVQQQLDMAVQQMDNPMKRRSLFDPNQAYKAVPPK